MTEDEPHEDKPGANSLGWHVERTEYPLTTPWMTVRQDDIRINEDIPATYTYVQAPPALFIVPVTSSGDVILIRQYRYALDQWVLEVPAGGTGDRPGIALLDVALDELREEIGGTCDEMRHIGTFYSWPSRTDQVVHIFLAIGVRLTAGQELETTELIEVVPTPLQRAFEMARSGEIADGQSAIALLRCEGPLRELGYLS